MNEKIKKGAILLVGIFFFFVVASIVLSLFGLQRYNIPTSGMAGTVPVGSKVWIFSKEFNPKRFEIITYHDPEGDTLTVPYAGRNYHSMVRSLGRKEVDREYDKVFVPLNERELRLGRCIGLPGDSVSFREGKIFVNNNLFEHDKQRTAYSVQKSVAIETKFKEAGIMDFSRYPRSSTYIFHASKNLLAELKAKNPEMDIEKVKEKPGYNRNVFPFDESFPWNTDFYGDIEIPRKGKAIELSLENLPLYERLIVTYEENNLFVKDSTIYINGKSATIYIPRSDYYFISGDNLKNSLDSRFYGFLPHDHVSGTLFWPGQYPALD